MQYGAGMRYNDQEEDGDLEFHQSALRNVVRSYRLNFSSSPADLFARLQDSLRQVHDRLTYMQEEDTPQRFFVSFLYKLSSTNLATYLQLLILLPLLTLK